MSRPTRPMACHVKSRSISGSGIHTSGSSISPSVASRRLRFRLVDFAPERRQLLLCLRPQLGEHGLIDLLIEVALRLLLPLALCSPTPGRSECGRRTAPARRSRSAGALRAQGRERVDLGLLDPPGRAPAVAAALGLLQRRRWQAQISNLLDVQRDRADLEVEIGELQIAQRLQLAATLAGISYPAGSKSER